jgi:capsular polysaccharide biosynthesis protein
MASNTKPRMNVAPKVQAGYRMYKHYLEEHTSLGEVLPEPKRALFISRKMQGTRKVLNEDSLIALLEGRGWIVEVITYETVDPYEASIMTRKAALIVTPHGAGVANALSCHFNTILLELHPFGMQKWVYAHLMKAMGNTYLYWTAPDELSPHTEASLKNTAEETDYYRDRNIIVDVGNFTGLIETAESLLLERGLF